MEMQVKVNKLIDRVASVNAVTREVIQSKCCEIFEQHKVLYPNVPFFNLVFLVYQLIWNVNCTVEIDEIGWYRYDDRVEPIDWDENRADHHNYNKRLVVIYDTLFKKDYEKSCIVLKKYLYELPNDLMQLVSSYVGSIFSPWQIYEVTYNKGQKQILYEAGRVIILPVLTGRKWRYHGWYPTTSHGQP
jgi:hypothetical protein